MTAERTAEEWGRVAVSLPGWRCVTVTSDGNIVKKALPLSRQQRRAKDRAEWKALDRQWANPQHPNGPRWMRRRKYKMRLRGLGVTR